MKFLSDLFRCLLVKIILLNEDINQEFELYLLAYLNRFTETNITNILPYLCTMEMSENVLSIILFLA